MAIRTFGEHDAATVQQLERCVAAEEGAQGVLCADGHLGYSMPIGGVVAYRDHVSPSGVGFDIALRQQGRPDRPHVRQVASDLARVMDEVFSRISFGVGRNDGRAGDHPVIDEIRRAAFEPQRKLADLAAAQLGTVGAGNHYVDLFRDEADDRVWIGVHFGSRGFGHKTASGFLALAAGLPFDARAPGGEMMSPPVVFAADSGLGEAYAEAMALAGRYAYAGRDVVVDEVLDILGTRADLEVHNHHNFAWREDAGGAPAWVVRKGATPAFPGQRGFVGATMGEPAVILEGVESDDSRAALLLDRARGRPGDVPHAGRGKLGMRMECSVRDCHFWVPRKDLAPRARCPDHPDARLIKRRGRIRPGAIDFAGVRAELAARGSSCAAAPPTRRRAPTSGSTRCSPTTPARSGSCTACTRSAWRWRPRNVRSVQGLRTL